MGFRNFFISIIKSLIVLFIATLVFSTITLDFPDLIKGVFGDIFAYASPDVQKQVVSKLAESCSSLEHGGNIVTPSQICANRSLFDSMRENCANYRELKRRNVRVENEEQIIETCGQIESGEFERACSEQQKGSVMPDFSKIGALCSDYKNGKIDDREFFFNVVSGALPGNIEAPKITALEKYNKAVNYLNSNKILYFVILLILMVILYLLVFNMNVFLLTLSQISFSLGILIMIPYIVIVAYDKFVGIDTTPILGSMFGAGNAFDFKAIVSVVLLLFLKTYNSFIITLGTIFLAVGIAGKVYGVILRRKIATKGKTKESRSRKKETAQDLLDELDKNAKKKKKKRN